MNYLAWLWWSIRGVRLNVVFRVVVGALQVSLGLAMVWLSKRFIDDTIRNGSDDDVFFMVNRAYYNFIMDLKKLGSFSFDELCQMNHLLPDNPQIQEVVTFLIRKEFLKIIDKPLN